MRFVCTCETWMKENARERICGSVGLQLRRQWRSDSDEGAIAAEELERSQAYV